MLLGTPAKGDAAVCSETNLQMGFCYYCFYFIPLVICIGSIYCQFCIIIVNWLFTIGAELVSTTSR